MPRSLPEDNPFRASVLPETQVLLAGQDLLTGLSSRAGLDAHFRLAVARARRSGARLAVGVVAVAVDPLQPPDEVFGHDLTMVEAAKRLRRCLRETDLVARLGETRFAFVAEEVPRDGVAPIAARVLRALQASPRSADGGARPQVGLVLWDGGEQTLPMLLRQAEQALTSDESPAGLSAANAESFGADDEPAIEPPYTTGQRVVRRVVGWLSLAILLVLALAATPPAWRAGWLPLENVAQQGWSDLQTRLPWLGQAGARR